MSSPRRESRLADNNRCQELSALVMALFDGETDELQTQRARNHLLVCQTCANRWLDWNRARSLLLEVPAPAPPETLVWRVLMACRGAAAHSAVPLKTKQARLNSNHVLTAPDALTELVPSALSDQILARTSRAATSAETRTGPSFLRRTKSLSWPMAVPAAALWLLILQREPLLSARLGAETVPAPATRQPRRSPANPNILAQNAALSISPPRHLADSRSSRDTVNAADSRAATRHLVPTDHARFRSASPALLETDLSVRQTSASQANDAILQRKWQEIEALTSNASRSVEWQSVAFNPGANHERREARNDNSNVQVFLPNRTEPRLKFAATLQRNRVGDKSQRAARLSHEQPELRLRAAQWQAATPRGASLIDTALPQTMPSRVSLPVALAPSSARLIAENFDAEEGRVNEMRSVVDDFRATVAPDDLQNPDEDEDDLG